MICTPTANSTHDDMADTALKKLTKAGVFRVFDIPFIVGIFLSPVWLFFLWNQVWWTLVVLIVYDLWGFILIFRAMSLIVSVRDIHDEFKEKVIIESARRVVGFLSGKK